jgi:diguanylate cyclase (GGDEF)-like protein/PAS domain S-box-containing protein
VVPSDRSSRPPTPGELTRTNVRYRALIQRSDALLAVVDADGQPQTWSAAWARLLQRPPREVVGAVLAALDGRRPPSQSAAGIRCRIAHADGSWRWLDAVATDLRADPEVGGTLVTAHDVTAEVEALRAVERANARFAALIEHGSDLIAVLDGSGAFLYASPTLPSAVNRRPDELLGSRLVELVAPSDSTTVARRLQQCGSHPGAVVTFECRVPVDDGQVRHMEVTVANRLCDPSVEGMVCNLRDVTERVQVVDRLQHQAMHDGLTGLPNRSLLLRRLTIALERARQTRSRCTLLYLDLDGFKKVNDSLGHAVGDAVLCEVADRLRAAVRPGDVVARMGGDEFVVMVDDVVDTAVVTEIAARVRDSLSRAIRVAHRGINVSCSIGIAVSDRPDPAALLQEADTALYRAKEKGRNRWELYDETMSVEARRRLDTEELLRTALDEDGLVLAYQPIVDLSDGRVTSVEALLRLRGSDGRLVAPGKFIEVAEETGLIVPVGAGVLDRACRQAARWRQDGRGAGMQVAVNVSPRQLGSPGLPSQVRATLAAWDLPGDHLCLELTENALIDAGFVVRSSLAELKEMGVSIAIDDFGTGWSSLAYLRRFPIDVVKIDRSFVSGLGIDAGDTEVVRAVVGLARALGLEVVAEGVETQAQRRALADLGCSLAQGYLFGRPVAADQLDLRASGLVGGGGRESNPPDGERPSHPL